MKCMYQPLSKWNKDNFSLSLKYSKEYYYYMFLYYSKFWVKMKIKTYINYVYNELVTYSVNLVLDFELNTEFHSWYYVIQISAPCKNVFNSSGQRGRPSGSIMWSRVV